MRKVLAAIGAVAAVALATPAVAQTTITFDSIPGTTLWTASSYTEGGILFTNSLSSDGTAVASWGPVDGANADPDGRTLLANTWDAYLVLTAAGGGTFDLASLDIADVYDGGVATPVAYSYRIGGVDHAGVFTLDNLAGLQTFNVNLSGLTSFGVQQTSGGGSQIDNVRIGNFAAAVPEPSTWALMLFGFGAVGFAMRRDRKTAGAALQGV